MVEPEMEGVAESKAALQLARTHADMKTPLNDHGGAVVLYNRLRRFGFTCEVSPTPWLYGTRITFFRSELR
jgi:hypothetical protein